MSEVLGTQLLAVLLNGSSTVVATVQYVVEYSEHAGGAAAAIESSDASALATQISGGVNNIAPHTCAHAHIHTRTYTHLIVSKYKNVC
jgi:hypothetical protein